MNLTQLRQFVIYSIIAQSPVGNDKTDSSDIMNYDFQLVWQRE